jgi:hypothetical protein
LGFLAILSVDDWSPVVGVLAAIRLDLRVAWVSPVRVLASAAAMRAELLVAMAWVIGEYGLLVWWGVGVLSHGTDGRAACESFMSVLRRAARVGKCSGCGMVFGA